jgi:hypothetical protein
MTKEADVRTSAWQRDQPMMQTGWMRCCAVLDTADFLNRPADRRRGRAWPARHAGAMLGVRLVVIKTALILARFVSQNAV